MPYMPGTMPLAGPWYLAQQRIAVTTFITLPLIWSCEYWRMWAEVMFPTPR